MAQRSLVGDGSSDLRTALGGLLVRLRGSAVDGVVPEHVFVESVRALALGDAEQDRLRDELGRLGLPVRKLHVHAEGDKRNGEKVVQNPGGNVSPRMQPVHNLIKRYLDADGYVTSRVLDGVVRLAGLQAHEAAQLRAGTPVRNPEAEHGPERPEPEERGGGGTGEAAVSEGAQEDGWEGVLAETEADEPDRADPEGEPPAEETAPGDLGEALAAAYAVLDADRYERHPADRLLSAQAEVGLAALIRGGADHIARALDEEELKALPPDDLRIRARDCLVLHNQRLVHSLVRLHLEQGLDYDDLLQHGFLGLLRAARKFDPTKGFKFSTYATWWIRQAITRAIADEGAVIRIPVHMHEQMRKVAGTERALAAEGRPATAADVAVMCDMTLQKVEEIRRLTRRTDSLDRVIGDGATLADFVGRTHVLPSVEKQVVDALHVEAALAVVDTFPERERRILVRRLGLDGDEPSTLDELGREFGVTRERIRQLEVKARPVFQERLRRAGLTGVGLDAVCEEAERAAERAAEAARLARIARATHAARTARARLALRRARAERGARAAGTEPQVTVASAPMEAGHQVGEGAPIVEAPVMVGMPESEEPVCAEEGARAETRAEAEAVPGAEESADADRAVGVEEVPSTPEAVPDAEADEAEPAAEAPGAEATAETVRAPVVAESPRDDPSVGAEARETGAAVSLQFTADWARATALVRPPFGGDVAWLAEYALLAVGRLQLGTLLGSSAAEAVVRAARQRGMLDRQVVKALEVLEGVFDMVKELGLRPEHFFERPAEVLRGVTPRTYLTDRPLVRGESRLAVRDALREFADAQAERNEQAPVPGEASEPEETRTAAEESAVQPSTDAVPSGGQQVTDEPAEAEPGEAETIPVDVSTTEGPDAALRAEYEVREARFKEEYERRLAEQRESAELRLEEEHRIREQRLAEVRQAADRRLAQERQAAERSLADERQAVEQRLAAARAVAEQEIDTWENILLTRMDTVMLRHGRRVRAEAEQRIAQHHEAYQALLRRTEHQEEAAQRAEGAEERVHVLERRLREYREGAEARIADLEARLAGARATTTERERAAGAWAAELETRLRKTEATIAERERAAASAREEYLQGAQVRVAEVEARLREAEAAVEQQKLLVEAARRRAEEAEQQAARRIAQSEHDAWLRITELQTRLGDVQAQLAAAQEAVRSRGSLRDRWLRS
ncbi:sigma-70 family RNA polymerase sigma factor [Streptomyces sp. GDS52]|uniref:sigma-70 family RNA polymerase sigma factor n=1 Tax=Streptomyces sp. GDS52 TaxID=3406419 RepID=UPI003FCEEB68